MCLCVREERTHTEKKSVCSLSVCLFFSDLVVASRILESFGCKIHVVYEKEE